MSNQVTRMPFSDWPIYDPDPKLTAELVRDNLISQGRMARRIGAPLSRCPPFKVSDMAIDWRNGWRWEDEEIKDRRLTKRKNQETKPDQENQDVQSSDEER